MILLPPVPPIVQNEATTQSDSLRVAKAFLTALRIPGDGLKTELIPAPDPNSSVVTYSRGESVWQITSPERFRLIVPYRAAYVAFYEDGRSSTRPARKGWSARLPVAKARGLAIATLHGLGVPKSWRGRRDRFVERSDRWPASSLWPFVAMTRVDEWPSGYPVIGGGNAAEISFEPATGVVQWFCVRRDVRCTLPKRTVGPKLARQALRFPIQMSPAPSPVRPANTGGSVRFARSGTSSSAPPRLAKQGQLVWDARSVDAPPRLAYRFGGGQGLVLVDAVTGRPR